LDDAQQRRTLVTSAGGSAAAAGQAAAAALQLPQQQQQHETLGYELKQITAKMFEDVKAAIADGEPKGGQRWQGRRGSPRGSPAAVSPSPHLAAPRRCSSPLLQTAAPACTCQGQGGQSRCLAAAALMPA
jgi:hypothetical protein